MSEVEVGTVEEFPEGQGRTVEVQGTPVAVFNVDGDLRAVHNTCKHKGGPLGEGQLFGSTVACPWHGWRYDVTTGQSKQDPSIGVETFDVEVRDGKVYVST